MSYVGNYIRAHSKNPREMIIYVTNRCNAKCSHCFFWKEMCEKTEEMTVDQFKRIAQSLSLDYLSLTGGEPFLRDDIVEVCEAFNGHAKVVFMPTNGMLTDKIYADVKEILRRCNFQFNLEVSLDGLEETHNRIRGVPIFKNAVDTINKLKSVVPVSVLTVASNQNYKELERLAEFVRGLGVKHGIAIIRGDPRDKSTQIPPGKVDEVHAIVRGILEKYMPEATVKERLAKRNKLKLLEYTMELLKGRKTKLVTCLAGRNNGVIYPNGDVAFCETLKPIGNLKDFDYNFQAVWRSKEADDLRKRIKDCYCAHDCFIPQSMLYNIRSFSKEIVCSLC